MRSLCGRKARFHNAIRHGNAVVRVAVKYTSDGILKTLSIIDLGVKLSCRCVILKRSTQGVRHAKVFYRLMGSL